MAEKWLSRLKKGLSKTRQNAIARIASIIKQSGKLDEETLSSIEEALLLADVGLDITMELVEGLKQKAIEERREDEDFVMAYLCNEIIRITSLHHYPATEMNEQPRVILVVGVNGVGKTTTIGKMAYQYASQNNKVLLAAADIFRAAAGEQLEQWAQRANVGIIRHQEGSDPASVIFDAISAARARKIDVVLIDTAGRLHTKSNLMEELKKMDRVLKKQCERYPHETILVLDATTGQNALQQARSFNDAVNCTSVVVTKLDGTAKGGMILSIQKELHIPVRMIGIGEGIEDMKPFNANEYAQALFDV